MRVVIAMMKHETNTFSPIATDWARFEEWGAYYNEEVPKAFAHTNMTLGAYLRLAEAAGAEIVTPIAAEAMPAGPVTADAFERMANAIVDAVSQGCDAVLLDLHGAMVVETSDDGEGTLLQRVREVAPNTPIAVTCDLHCNLTEAMVAHCDALIGYKTYPHTDMFEVGHQVGQILFDQLAGRCRPTMAWGNIPLLSQTLRQGSDDEPMRSLLAMARQAETDGEVLAATVFGGFALADTHQTGTSVVVVTDNDPVAAQRVVDRLLDFAWQQRAGFIYQHHPLEAAIATAKQCDDGPVILLDHSDNTGSGGTQDVMTVIAEVLRQRLQDVAVAAVWDPHAVQQMQQAGIGAQITLDLGGKTEMPAIDLQGQPLRLSGRVKCLSDGRWQVRGPMYHGLEVNMGHSAVLDTGAMQIVIVSHHHEPWDQGVFTSLGIDPAAKRYLLLKSRIHYRAGFAALAKQTFTCDGDGVTTSDNRLLRYHKLRRPIYPLDQINARRGE